MSNPLNRPIPRRLAIAGAAGIGAAGLLSNPQLAAAAPGGRFAYNIAPNGTDMPLGWHDIGADRPAGQVPEPLDPLQAMRLERRYGFNMVHRYADDKPRHDEITMETLRLAERARMAALLQLPFSGGINDPGGRRGLPEGEIATYIQARAASDALGWWDIPEEMRYWYANEMAIVRDYAAWTRKYDPLQRPVMMYTPNHYRATAIASYVPHLDIVPVSTYTKYARQSHAWVAWRLKELMEGIRLAGATIGTNHLQGEKTPIAAIELYKASNGDWMTPEGAYHDFWCTLANGARGIFIYSFYRRNGGPVLEECLDVYNQAARQLTGAGRLDRALVHGQEATDITVEVTAGQAQSDPFQPNGLTEPITMPSISARAVRHRGVLHVVMVNSHTEPVSARVSGVQRRGRALLPFERDTVAIRGGTIDLDFDGLGVHVLRIPGA